MKLFWVELDGAKEKIAIVAETFEIVVDRARNSWGSSLVGIYQAREKLFVIKE